MVRRALPDSLGSGLPGSELSGVLQRSPSFHLLSHVVDCAHDFALNVFEEFFRVGIAHAGRDRDPPRVDRLNSVSTVTRTSNPTESVRGLPLGLRWFPQPLSAGCGQAGA